MQLIEKRNDLIHKRREQRSWKYKIKILIQEQRRFYLWTTWTKHQTTKGKNIDNFGYERFVSERSSERFASERWNNEALNMEDDLARNESNVFFFSGSEVFFSRTLWLWRVFNESLKRKYWEKKGEGNLKIKVGKKREIEKEWIIFF